MFDNLGRDASLERLLFIAELMDAVEDFAKVLANLLVPLAIPPVIHFEHLLIVGPIVWQLLEGILAQG